MAILGETGTGKELLARVLHASSDRAKEPFVAVNVAALPPELLESELFGHGKGAFTGAVTMRRGLFEAAHKGTLFLDEIGEMSTPLQAKLLRTLQDGEVRRVGENEAFAVDVRIVCATHRDLARSVADGTFREDLFYRLRVLTLRMPPLRERGDDILPLATQFLTEEKSMATQFSLQAAARLQAHVWPGNVRELQNAVKHGAALATSTEITESDLPEDLGAYTSVGREGSAGLVPNERPVPQKTLLEVERDHVLRVLDASGGSQAEAARVLGIGRNTLWRKLRAYAAETETKRSAT